METLSKLILSTARPLTDKDSSVNHIRASMIELCHLDV